MADLTYDEFDEERSEDNYDDFEEGELVPLEEGENDSSKSSLHPSSKLNERTHSKMLYQGRTQPNLPHILSDYGMETKKTKHKKKSAKVRRDRERAKERKKTPQYDDLEDERDIEREKIREEKYLSVVDDLQKLRNYYYREYRDLLTDKIIHQRQQIKERSEAMMNRARLNEEAERQAAKKNRKKPTKHVVIHNDDYLKNIHRTDMSKIVNLQMRLQKEGKLKTQTDIDQFWVSLQDPQVFAMYFGPDQSLSPEQLEELILSPTGHPRPLSQIAESNESSRPNTRGDNWAVTQQYKHQHKAGGVNRQKTNMSVGKQAAVTMENRCPLVEMPPLHCFNMDLTEKPPDPDVVSQKVQLKAIEKQRKKFMGKLQKMHQLAMANNALAARILNQHEDMTMFLNGPDLSDLISDYYYNKKPVQSPPGSYPESDHLAVELVANKYPVLPDIPSRSGSETSQLSVEDNVEEKIGEEKDKSPKAICDTPSESKLKMIMHEPSKPLPLTMKDVMEQCRVMEAKGLSSNWSNYMRAGKAS